MSESLNIYLDHIKPSLFEYNQTTASIWDKPITLSTQNTYQILASSGLGKSTIVSFLAGLRGDYTGEIVIDEKKMSSYNTDEWSIWRSRCASFVFQDLRLFPELTAEENIKIVDEIKNKKEPPTLSNYEAIASRLGVSAKLKNAVKFLSFGQMQRVAIIRALNRNYNWLILDEPFSHLDLDNAKIAWDIIKEDATSKNAGIIITTLDPYPFITPDNVFIL